MTDTFAKYVTYLKSTLNDEDFKYLSGYIDNVNKALDELSEVSVEFVYNVSDMIEALLESMEGEPTDTKIVDDDDLVEAEEGEMKAEEEKESEKKEEEEKSFDEKIRLGFEEIMRYINDGNLYNPNNKYQERGYMLIKKEEETYKLGVKGTRGITTCGVCKMDNIIIYSAQKRGADEGETIFNTCVDCGHKWVIR